MIDFLNWKLTLLTLPLWFPAGCLTAGCASLPDKSFDVINGLGAQAAEGLKQGVGQWSASFEGVEPGYTVEGGVKYFATAKLEGVAGQFHAGVQGDYSSDGTGAIAALVMRDSSLSAEAKWKLLEKLAVQQASSPPSATGEQGEPNPVPAPPVAGGLSDTDKEWLADEIEDAVAATKATP